MKRYFGLFLFLVTFGSLSLLIHVESASAAGISVGLAPSGTNALEFIGRSTQEGDAITHYGYFSFIYKLERDFLFSDSSDQNERTARFTYYATSTLDGRYENKKEEGNIIVTSASLEMTIYFNEAPNGDFNDPNSFKNGQVIATYGGRYHNTLNIQAPNIGNTLGSADVSQDGVFFFELNGEKYVLGRKGSKEHIVITGRGKKTQDEPLQSSFLLGGSITVTK